MPTASRAQRSSTLRGLPTAPANEAPLTSRSTNSSGGDGSWAQRLLANEHRGTPAPEVRYVLRNASEVFQGKPEPTQTSPDITQYDTKSELDDIQDIAQAAAAQAGMLSSRGPGRRPALILNPQALHSLTASAHEAEYHLHRPGGPKAAKRLKRNGVRLYCLYHFHSDPHLKCDRIFTSFRDLVTHVCATTLHERHLRYCKECKSRYSHDQSDDHNANCCTRCMDVDCRYAPSVQQSGNNLFQRGSAPSGRTLLRHECIHPERKGCPRLEDIPTREKWLTLFAIFFPGVSPPSWSEVDLYSNDEEPPPDDASSLPDRAHALAVVEEMQAAMLAKIQCVQTVILAPWPGPPHQALHDALVDLTQGMRCGFDKIRDVLRGKAPPAALEYIELAALPHGAPQQAANPGEPAAGMSPELVIDPSRSLGEGMAAHAQQATLPPHPSTAAYPVQQPFVQQSFDQQQLDPLLPSEMHSYHPPRPPPLQCPATDGGPHVHRDPAPGGVIDPHLLDPRLSDDHGPTLAGNSELRYDYMNEGIIDYMNAEDKFDRTRLEPQSALSPFPPSGDSTSAMASLFPDAMPYY